MKIRMALICTLLWCICMSALAIPLPDSIAPDFEATAVIPVKNNPAGKIVEGLRLSSLFGTRRIMLLTYPKNCTFICPTELITLNKKLDKFKALGYEVLVLSTDEASLEKDPEASHQAWRLKSAKPEEGSPMNPIGIGNVGFIMLSDPDRKIIKTYGIEGADGLALRATFFIDLKGRVRIAEIQSNSIGRDVEDLYRKAAAVVFEEEHEGKTVPAEGWQPGDPGMKPGHEGVRKQVKRQG